MKRKLSTDTDKFLVIGIFVSLLVIDILPTRLPSGYPKEWNIIFPSLQFIAVGLNWIATKSLTWTTILFVLNVFGVHDTIWHLIVHRRIPEFYWHANIMFVFEPHYSYVIGLNMLAISVIIFLVVYIGKKQ